MEQAKIHLYHGTGKGKTTAAVGLSIRAVGAGKKVLFVQLMKGNDSSEMKVLRKIPEVHVIQVGKQYGFSWNMDAAGKKGITDRHNEMLREALQILKEGKTDLLVLDEVVSASRYEMADRVLIRKIMEEIKDVEIVLTGRDPEEYFLEKADYITEMKAQRHPYEKGLMAREGIEW